MELHVNTRIYMQYMTCRFSKSVLVQSGRMIIRIKPCGIPFFALFIEDFFLEFFHYSKKKVNQASFPCKQ